MGVNNNSCCVEEEEEEEEAKVYYHHYYNCEFQNVCSCSSIEANDDDDDVDDAFHQQCWSDCKSE